MESYKSAGVDYDVLDAAKREALAQALATTAQLSAHGATGVDRSRGEPAFIFRFAEQHLAVVLECLGTKSVLAREYLEASDIDRFAAVAYDTVAAIVNDLCCVGALPLVVNAYFSTGSSEWYGDAGRASSLVDGWRRGCEDAGACWGGGESPALSGLVMSADIELAGSAVGYVPQGVEPILGEDLGPGDAVVLVASSGLHANGASVARRVVRELDDGLLHRLPSGATLGEALLTPTLIYVPLVAALLRARAQLTYISHITGHGLRKLMRADNDLRYRIAELPPVPEVLAFLAERADMDAREAYGTFNMGTGLALFCKPEATRSVVEVARGRGFDAIDGGIVEAGARSVVLEPLDVVYSREDLRLR